MRIDIWNAKKKMNKKEYYTRQKDPWEERELDLLRTEYVTKEMTVSQIADIHKRTPGSISYKLQKLDLITHNASARGYSEYKQSALYKEIVETSKLEDAAKKEKAKGKETGTETGSRASNKKVSPSWEIAELKLEMVSLQKDVKEILRLMNALYEFESQ